MRTLLGPWNQGRTAAAPVLGSTNEGCEGGGDGNGLGEQSSDIQGASGPARGRVWLPLPLGAWLRRQRTAAAVPPAGVVRRKCPAVKRMWGGFKVVCWHEGRRYALGQLRCAELAALACDVLTVKAAVDSLPAQHQQPAGGATLCLRMLRLHSTPPAHSYRWTAATGSQLRSTAFEDLHRQLADSLRMQQNLSGGGKEAAGPALLRAAAAVGATCVIQLLLPLLRLPEAALAAELPGGVTALHWAVRRECLAAMSTLLAAAPAAAAAKVGWSSSTPLHWAAQFGCTTALQLLLAVAPGTVEARNRQRKTALHIAAGQGHVAAVQLLLVAAPGQAAARDKGGALPLHAAAEGGHAAVVSLLLDCGAAPHAATAQDNRGWTPLHSAADGGQMARGPPGRAAGGCDGGHAAAVQLLLAAAPEAASMTNGCGRTPLVLAIRWSQWAAARCLADAAPRAAALAAVAQGGVPARHLLPACVAAHAPLAEAEWALVPAHCPGLTRALPAALAHSAEQARQLVRRLPPADAERLRAFALALARLQRTGAVPPLPQLVVDRLLSHFGAQ